MRACLLAAVLVLAHASIARSVADEPGDSFTGVLKRLHDRGTVVIGYRESAFPFSYAPNGRPVGYTIDLCLRVVQELERTVGRQLRVDYVPVASHARLDAIRGGRIDLECSSTTPTADRHRNAAFSPIIFVTGTRLLARRDGTVRGYPDLSGKTIVVTAGTTSEMVVRRLMDHDGLHARIVTVSDPDKALALLRDGGAAAIAGDDVRLHRLVTRHETGGSFSVVGDFLSFEPYGIMFAKDDLPLADAVGRAFVGMARKGDLLACYDRWFEQPTPGGGAPLHLPMSKYLSEVFYQVGSGE